MYNPMFEEMKIQRWKVYLTLLFSILAFLFGVISSYVSLHDTVYAHIADSNVHMPFSEKIKVFVPRTEFEAYKERTNSALIDLKNIMSETQKDVKLLLRRN